MPFLSKETCYNMWGARYKKKGWGHTRYSV